MRKARRGSGAGAGSEVAGDDGAEEYGDTHGGGGAGVAGLEEEGAEDDAGADVGGVAHGDEHPETRAQPSATAATRRTPAIPPR